MKKTICILGILAFLFVSEGHAVELNYTVAPDSIFQNGTFSLVGENSPYKVFAVSETRRINTNRDLINPGQNFYFWRPDVDFPPEPGKCQMFITDIDGNVINQCYFYFEKKHVAAVITIDELENTFPLDGEIQVNVVEVDHDLIRLSLVIDDESYKIADFIGGNSTFSVIPSNLIGDIRYDAAFFIRQHRIYFSVEELGVYPKNVESKKEYTTFTNAYSYQHQDIIFVDSDNSHMQSCLSYFNNDNSAYYEHLASGNILLEGLYLAKKMGADAVISSNNFSHEEAGFWNYVGSNYPDIIVFIPVIQNDYWDITSLPENIVLVSKPEQYKDGVDLVGMGDYAVSYVNYKMFSEFWSLRKQYSGITVMEFYDKFKKEFVVIENGYPVIKQTTSSIYGYGGNNSIPSEFQLHQNYPNPFNPSTTITYDLPVSGYVNLAIYNIEGQKVDTLVNDYKTPGHYQVVLDAKRLSSGVYFYKLETDKNVQIRKMELIK